MLTFEEIDAHAKLLFSGHNAIEEWGYIDEADRNYWRKLTLEKFGHGVQDKPAKLIPS